MKAKLMAVLLAAGLGVTGIAGTAQAAEVGTRAVNNCRHEHKRFEREDVLMSKNWSNDSHYVEYRRTYYCPDCSTDVEEYEATYESHDWEQIYHDNGKVESHCTVCDAHMDW